MYPKTAHMYNRTCGTKSEHIIQMENAVKLDDAQQRPSPYALCIHQQPTCIVELVALNQIAAYDWRKM